MDVLINTNRKSNISKGKDWEADAQCKEALQ